MAARATKQQQTSSDSKAAPVPAQNGKRAEKTRLLVLDTAERLFSLQGYDGTGVRQIADEAGVNLGAIHYYWRSKEALCREALERRLIPILEQRSQAIDRVDPRPDNLAALLDASHRPSLLAGGAPTDQAAAFRQFYGRMLFDPSPEVQAMLASMLDAYAKRFVEMLRDASTELSDHEFYWRLTFLYGAFLYAHTQHTRTIGLWGDRFQKSNYDDAATFLTRFLEGGLRAPPAHLPWPQDPPLAPARKRASRTAPASSRTTGGRGRPRTGS